MLTLVFLLNFLIILYVWAKTKGKKRSKNIFLIPYKEDDLTEEEFEVVHEKSFDKNEIPEKLDAIVIGSGISGLTVAGLMSKYGKRVLVLEQCEKAGGFTHTFKEEGHEFCSGVHYLSYCRENGLFATIYDVISDGKIKWSNFGECYDQVIIGDKTYDIMIGDKYQEKLIEYFPKEEEKIKWFYRECMKVLKQQKDVMQLRLAPSWMRPILAFFKGKTFLKYQKVTIAELVEKTFEDDHLKVIFAYMFLLVGKYSTTPASMVMGAISSYNKGAYYPTGGCSIIAKSICSVIEKHGGKTMVNAEVDQILLDENDVAVGVKMKGGVEIKAPKVISCAGIYNTYKYLLPKRFNKFTKDYKPSPPAQYVYLGIDASPKELGFPENNVIYFESFEAMSKDIWIESDFSKKNFPAPYIFAGMVHHMHPNPNPNKSSVIVMTQSKYEWYKEWENLPCKNRGNDYNERKKVIEDLIVKQFIKLYPKVEGKIEYIDSGTPLSVNHWVKTNFGESYGKLNETTSLFDQHRYPKGLQVRNFFVTGQDHFFTCGVNSAAMSGVITANEILEYDLMYHISEKMILERKKK